MNKPRSLAEVPIHPLGALSTIVLDLMWVPLEGGAMLTGLGILAIPCLSLGVGFINFCAVFMVQNSLAKDSFGESFAKAAVLAILAAVPFPVMGTSVGVILLGWAGLGALNNRQLPPGKP